VYTRINPTRVELTRRVKRPDVRSMVNDADATPLGKIVIGSPDVVTWSIFHSVSVPSGRRRITVLVARSALCSSLDPVT
jgi:hypothetical protein